MYPRNTPLDTDSVIQQSRTKIPQLTDKEKILPIIGKRVQVQHHYHGKVIGLNTSPYGAFPASVYPVIIKLDKDFHGRMDKEHAFKFDDFIIEE